MKAVIDTDRSALVLHKIDSEMCDIIRQCAEICDPELLVKPDIIVYGKVCHQNRSVGFYSDTSIGYYYSGKIAPSKKLHPCMQELLAYVNDKFGYDYNGILINKYDGGSEYLSKHSDDETGLDPRVGVVAISYGAVRKFRIRDKKTGKIVMDIPTDPDKMIQMYGHFQKEFTHEIPVEKKVNGVRYSFTFRKHLV